MHNSPILRNIIWTTRVNLEEQTSKNWSANYAWLLEEDKELKRKLREVTQNSAVLSELESTNKKEEVVDDREMPPYPKVTSKLHGWLSGRKEFQLETFGPDVVKAPPLTDEEKLYNPYT